MKVGYMYLIRAKIVGPGPFFLNQSYVYTCIFICWEGGQCQLFDIYIIYKFESTLKCV